MDHVGAIVAACLLGAAGWTLLEYALHRFVFHGASASGPGAREHRKHHARSGYFAPWWQKALAAAGGTAILLPVALFVAGSRAGLAFTTGFIGMYIAYEILHRRAHTHPPSGPYGRWRRKNHFAHHFADPRRAHGVTTPVWDVVFGTRLQAARVRVPRRMAMPWLIDARGELFEAYAADYALVGQARSDAATARADTDAAMANRSPTG